MQPVFLCYAEQDRQFSKDLTEFLGRGAGVQVFLDDGELADSESIVSKAADGLPADVALLVLSPNSVPKPWLRPKWEPALLTGPKSEGARVGFVLAGACDFPPLLRREPFFDATGGPLAAFREIKRWLVGLAAIEREVKFEPARQPYFEGRDAEMEALRQALSDAPGISVITGTAGAGKTTLALEFARQSKREFEGLVWLSCAGQSVAGLTGEMASQLGMKLEHDEEQNLNALAGFCAQRRLLLVLDDAPEGADRLIAGGMSSTLLTTPEAGLFQETAGESIPISPVGEDSPRRALAASGPELRNLLAAACACGDAPFRPQLAAELAELDRNSAGELLLQLIARGLVIQLDARYSRCVTHSSVREAMAPPDHLARKHAQAVHRLFAEWAAEETECGADLPQLRRAIEWALGQGDDATWVLACEMTRRGVDFLKRELRQAEAFELLQAAAWTAERRGDWRFLDNCLREQIWILESWDRIEEADRLGDKRRVMSGRQMVLDLL